MLLLVPLSWTLHGAPLKTSSNVRYKLCREAAWRWDGSLITHREGSDEGLGRQGGKLLLCKKQWKSTLVSPLMAKCVLIKNAICILASMCVCGGTLLRGGRRSGEMQRQNKRLCQNSVTDWSKCFCFLSLGGETLLQTIWNCGDISAGHLELSPCFCDEQNLSRDRKKR